MTRRPLASFFMLLGAPALAHAPGSGAGAPVQVRAPAAAIFTRGPDVTHIDVRPDSASEFTEITFGMAGAPQAGRTVDVLYMPLGVPEGLPPWRQYRQAYAMAFAPRAPHWMADSGRLRITAAAAERLSGSYELWLRRFPQSLTDTVAVLRVVRGAFVAQRDRAAERGKYPER